MSTQSNLGEFDDVEKDVYVTSSVSRGALVYHTDPECQHVTDEHKTIPLRSAKDRWLDECKTCSGDAEQDTPSPSDQCGAPTTKGHPCTLKSLTGFDRCSRHLDFENGVDSNE